LIYICFSFIIINAYTIIPSAIDAITIKKKLRNRKGGEEEEMKGNIRGE
jgi:hypothetical protein